MGDLISRKDAIDAIHCDIVVHNKQDAELVAKTIGTFVDRIKVLPPAEPERKTGKWISDTTNYYEERFICSECGRNYKVDACMGKPIWNFCPNCSADMRGANNG